MESCLFHFPAAWKGSFLQVTIELSRVLSKNRPRLVNVCVQTERSTSSCVVALSQSIAMRNNRGSDIYIIESCRKKTYDKTRPKSRWLTLWPFYIQRFCSYTKEVVCPPTGDSCKSSLFAQPVSSLVSYTLFLFK